MSLKKHREAMRAGFEGEIIAQASEEFDRHGVENLSMRRLAKRLGCAVGTLYLYYKDKDDLLRAVVDDSFTELLEAVQAVPASSDPIERLRARFRAYIVFGIEHPSHYRCAFSLPDRRATGAYRPHSAFDVLRENIRECIVNGSLDVPEEQASQLIWASVHGLTSLFIARPRFPWVDRDALIEGLAEVMISGLKKTGQRRGK